MKEVTTEGTTKKELARMIGRLTLEPGRIMIRDCRACLHNERPWCGKDFCRYGECKRMEAK